MLMSCPANLIKVSGEALDSSVGSFPSGVSCLAAAKRPRILRCSTRHSDEELDVDELMD